MKNKLIISLLIIFTVLFLPGGSAVAQTDTQSLIAQLQEQIKALQVQLEQMKTELKTTRTELEEVKAEIRFTKILRKGMSGEEVKQLQEFLKQFPDIYPEGKVTGYFGYLTEKAVKKFQEQNAKEVLNPLGITEATGVVGKSTIAKLNELAQGAIPAIPATPAQPSPGEGIPAIPAVPAVPATQEPISLPTPIVATSTATTTSITVVYPNGGEHFQKGSTYTIVWNSLNVSEVFIRLVKKNEIYAGVGGTISNVIPNSGYYKWTVPTTLLDDKDYTIQVVAGNYGAFDESDSFFAILTKAPVATPIPTIPPSATTTPSITILYPNGGEQWQKGTTQLIKWNSTNVSTVYIKLRKGSDTYATSSAIGATDGMVSGTIPNVYYFQWNIPTTLPDGNDYAIRVISGDSMGTGPLDDSDAVFSIVTSAPVASPTPVPTTSPTPVPTVPSLPSPSPSPSPSPTPAATTTIATTTASYPGFFMSTDKQSYSKGETIYLTIIRADAGSYAYYVDLYAISHEFSTIKVLLQGNLNVSSPSGITPQINTATIEPFKSGSSGFYSLLICAGGQECVGGVNTNSVVVSYTSISTSTATTTASVAVVSPNGGESWTIGSAYPIQWTAPSNAVIRLDLIDSNGGLAMYNLVNIAGNPGIAQWQIPSYTNPGHYLVKAIACVGAACNSNFVNMPAPTACDTSPCYNDSSDNYFSIVSAATTTTATTTSGCTGLSLTFADNKTNYTQGEMVNYTWSCVPSGAIASNVTIKVDNVTYNTTTNSGTQTFGFGTSNFSTGPHTIKACFDPNCSPSPSVIADFNVLTPDTALPIISAVSASAAADSATIAWTTDEPSDSSVEFGLTTSYGSQTAMDSSLATNHSVNISGLSPGTTYHYRVKSRDASNNLANSGDYTFTIEQAIAMTIKGRVVNGLTGQPVANSNMFIWNWKGSARRDFYINSDGTFSINLTADDIANASAMYVNYVYVNGSACYDQSSFTISKTASNSISSIAVNGPGGYQNIAGIVNRTVQPTGAETDIGDLLVWPVTGFNLTSDIPVRFNGYFEDGSGGAGNTNYRTSHGFSTFYPIEINTKITLTDQSGNQYNSPYVKYPAIQHCSQVTLNFSNGQFSWNPAGIVSGSAATSTSPSSFLENISSQVASIAEAISRIIQEIKNLAR